MSVHLQFDFLVDKTNNTLTIRREFRAKRQLVWDAYTKSELLDQWFAPKPFTTKTKHMDFREGGYWLYAMVDPEGKEYWGRMDYEKIRPVESYSGLDAFCDENGQLNTGLPRANWDVTFHDKGNNAVVETIVTYASLSDIETVIKMGMEEGMASTLEKLDELLSALQ
ncbi:SRPBCC family protein [Chitinophaga qingshengii]|uniref:SRPBCC domain-containing protein n=1 Tax=Chitinophaga qingshengii TaxID=1569794 RepID=A0ABR7TP90_9BACT|nr:SRPBCC domain-containing protein [Chitinophaga qingshengii]MBC9931800.1 SRPBCC domain-containing protein [Chitinophaga qingshengii]